MSEIKTAAEILSEHIRKSELSIIFSPEEEKLIYKAMESYLQSRRPTDELLESQEFYQLMQAYRHAPISDQDLTTKNFEAVKIFLRDQIFKTKEE